jgi:hypothetical protein
VDSLIYASSMVMLDSARRKTVVPALARWLLGLGIAATLAANVAHGLGHGLAGATVAAWPAVALVGSYELLMMVVRGVAGQGCRVRRLRRCHFASAAQPASSEGTSRTGVASIGSINGSRPGTTAMSPPRGKGRARPGRPRQRQGVPASWYLPSRASPDPKSKSHSRAACDFANYTP